jgi:hypothetical protein
MLYNCMRKSIKRKDEISAGKAYLATIEREKRAKRARDEFKNYHKGAKKAVSTLEKGYEDLPIESRFKVEKNMNKLFDDRNKQSKQAKKNRARYEKKFKEEERDLPKKLPYESELIRGARLALAEAVLREMSKEQAKAEVRRYTGPPKRARSGHTIGGSYSHHGDLPKAVRKILSPTDAFFATDVRETPEQNKQRRKNKLKKP